MRSYYTILITLFIIQNHYGQPCPLPDSFEKINPDRCGLRYVHLDEGKVQVILDFEKVARIKRRNAASKSTGVKVTLKGLFKLSYDSEGNFLKEERYYLNHPKFPDDAVAYDINHSFPKVVEEEFQYMAKHIYDSLPWNTSDQVSLRNDSMLSPGPPYFYDSGLRSLPSGQIQSIRISKHILANRAESRYQPRRLTIDLSSYDDPNKKQYWLQASPSITNPKDGRTLFGLSRMDLKSKPPVYENIIRLIKMDSMGNIEHTEDMAYDHPMELIFHHTIYQQESDYFSTVDKLLFIFREKFIPEVHPHPNLAKNHFYFFDKSGAVVSQGTFSTASDAPVFYPLDYQILPDGILFIVARQDRLETSFLSYSGAFQSDSTPSGSYLSKRIKRAPEKLINYKLAIEPQFLHDGSLVYVFEVLENIGINSQSNHVVVDGRYHTSICHGLTVVQMTAKGEILTSGFYDRPKDVDPQAHLTVHSLVESDDSCIFFFINEKLSKGSYPVLFTIKNQSLSFSKNEMAFSAMDYIYFDSKKPVISYFGVSSDPENHSQPKRTIEILRLD